MIVSFTEKNPIVICMGIYGSFYKKITKAKVFALP
jgi:hypothetical protein